MAIPFYEPKKQDGTANHHHQQQQSTNQFVQQQQPPFYEEGDQVDGPANTSPSTSWTPPTTTQHDVMAWKILALAMCQALKNNFQQTSSPDGSSSTAVIQILPNGQVKPSWN